MNLRQFVKIMFVVFISIHLTSLWHVTVFAARLYGSMSNNSTCSVDLEHKKQRPRFRLSSGCASVCCSAIAPTRFIALRVGMT